ncbi:CotH kinase family protein [Haliangium sp.]|uniref:CotH kinase family protein n=1 Tax=Haliangium sp. TaxID=2663208 RepID=UPI003D12DC22
MDPEPPDAGIPDNPPPPPPPPLPLPPLYLSEIMYHPVLDEGFEERHEFVEIHNAGATAVALAGWTLGGGISYEFSDQTVLEAGGYLVVAKERDALLALAESAPAYAIEPELIVGDFLGALDNGGDTVVLIAPDARVADTVAYDDDAPWPLAADALGAGESWLADELLPLEQHRYLGRSLERVSFEVDAFEVANWVASPLDAPTPGRPNAGARNRPLAVVLDHQASPMGATDALIRDTDEVLMRVRLSDDPEGEAVELDYFVDDLDRTDETITTVPLLDDGQGGDREAGDRVYSASLPPQDEQSIVRYRIRVVSAGESRQVAPRASDPQGWHGFFVSPYIDSQTRTYQVYIGNGAWTQMWTNINPGRVVNEVPNPLWNVKVPAVFVFDGRVYDVRVRHQGSRYQRKNGDQISDWPGLGPDQPDPLRALSWRIQFPRYDRFEGKKVVTLNKLRQSCPGLTAGVGMRLFANAGVPAAQTRYARLHINGYYYRYMLEIERPGEDLLERYYTERGLSRSQAQDEIGNLFKATGVHFDEGPYGPADGRLLDPYRGFSPEERYAFTYDRKTHKWQGHEPLIALIEGMNDARAQGDAAMRAFLDANFDMDTVLNYLAVMNWSVPFDDMFHNHYLYQRRDGKWLLMPWDLDRNFGDWTGERRLGPRSSIYVGEEGDPDNRGGSWNYFKDTVLAVYRSEFEDRLRQLNQGLLHPDNVKPLVDEVIAGAALDEVNQALAGQSCNFESAATNFKDFVDARHAFVVELFSGAQ